MFPNSKAMTIWSRLGVLKKKVLFLLGGLFVNYSSLFAIYSKKSSVRNRVVNVNTDVCIEGFQRSGNSYLFMCLSVSNPHLRIAHHIHGIAQIRLAVKLGVPCIVLIRDPAASLASLLTWDDRLGVDIAIKSYLRYYKGLLSLPMNVFFVDFEDLIVDVNKVIRAFNECYMLGIKELSMTKTELKAVMNDRQHKYINRASAPFPNKIKRISNSKNKEIILTHDDFLDAQKLYTVVKGRVSY